MDADKSGPDALGAAPRTTQPLRVALVALPWAAFDRPSAAVGLLGAVLRTRRPAWEVSIQHAYVELFQALQDVYEAVASEGYLGEVAFAGVLWPERRASVVDALERWARGTLPRVVTRDDVGA